MSGDEFEKFDAAYVLSALTAADRRRFEEHLQQCDECVARVARMWRLPDLLALAPDWAFDTGSSPATAGAYQPSVVEPAGADAATVASDAVEMPDLLPELLDRVRFERRRRRVLGVSAAVALAACVITLVVALVGGGSAGPDRAPAQARRLVNVVPVQMVASVQVVRHDRWDQVDLWCTYLSNQLPPGGGNYLAVARDRAGRSEVVGSWPAIPGQTAVIRTPTTFPAGHVSSVEITSSTGLTLARISV